MPCCSYNRCAEPVRFANHPIEIEILLDIEQDKDEDNIRSEQDQAYAQADFEPQASEKDGPFFHNAAQVDLNFPFVKEIALEGGKNPSSTVEDFLHGFQEFFFIDRLLDIAFRRGNRPFMNELLEIHVPDRRS